MSQVLGQKNTEILLIQAIYDTDGRTPKTGLAGTITTTLRDEDGAAPEAVTVTEQGASGYYEIAFTPLNARAGGYSYQLDIVAPTGTSDESIYGFEIRVFDSVQFAAGGGSFLTTLTKVKEFLGIPAAETAHDTLLTDLIARATDKVERRMGRKLIQATFTEFHDGLDHPEIQVNSPPIASITTLHESIDQDFTAGNLIAAEDYIFDVRERGGIVRRKANVDFGEGFQNVKIVYVGGYATIPAALEDIGIKITAWWFGSRKRLGLTGESLRESSFSAGPLPERINKTLHIMAQEFNLPGIV